MATATRAWMFIPILVAFVLSPRQAGASQNDLGAVVAEAFAGANRYLAGRLPESVKLIGDINRRPIVDDVFEYSFLLRVGAGAHDVIGLHRVIRERHGGVPVHTTRAVFMVHGDIWGFDAAFLGSTRVDAIPRDHSIGVFLARHDVDVWGIDLRWVQVPAETVDFSFMSRWGIATDIRDIGTAVMAARAVRAATQSGWGPLTLLGWSRGALLVYAYASAEASLPAAWRQVSAIIPVDMVFKFGPQHEEQRRSACSHYIDDKAFLDSGRYQTDTGSVVQLFGGLAATRPADPSPIIAGLSNRQAALIVAAATSSGELDPIVPLYHFNAGTFDDMGLPAGLRFTREEYLYDFFQLAAPFQSFRQTVETDALWCNEVDVPFDDHLAEIAVPVLYVGAAGGFGSFGTDTLRLLRSTDVTTHIVQLAAPGARAIDFGHVDLLTADNSDALVWKPILDWIGRH